MSEREIGIEREGERERGACRSEDCLRERRERESECERVRFYFGRNLSSVTFRFSSRFPDLAPKIKK